MGIDQTEFLYWGIKIVGIARKEEPRINRGTHLVDWMNICDDDDNFNSFYGSDYFKDC